MTAIKAASELDIWLPSGSPLLPKLPRDIWQAFTLSIGGTECEVRLLRVEPDREYVIPAGTWLRVVLLEDLPVTIAGVPQP